MLELNLLSLSLGAGAPDPVTPVILGLAVILLAAKLGAELAMRVGLPAVLGELVAGVVLGNLALVGVDAFVPMAHDPYLSILASLGVLLLLFEVGLESTVGQMLRVGWPSLFVAVLGVAAPFALGYGASAWLIPTASGYTHAFIGATLCATSVGITARVLRDLGRSQSAEARIILGAAVVDDVLGLVVLAVVSGLIAANAAGEALSYGSVGWVIGKATIFLVGSLALGVWLSPKVFRMAARLMPSGVLLATGLAFCFGLAALAAYAGLAPIVGAFAAGLILEEMHTHEFVARGEQSLEHLVAPLSSFLAPVFFVLMGARTDLTAFADWNVLLLAGALTVAAIIGKQACSLGALGRGLDALSIGLGMIPRGEVGLIFANIGLSLSVGGQPVLSSGTYASVVLMVIITTMVTPPALSWRLRRAG